MSSPRPIRPRPGWPATPTAVLNQTLLHLAAFHGLARENMTRAQGWRFLDIGLRLERAVYLCTLLDCALRSAEGNNPSLLEAVLEVADSSLTYRSRYTLLPNIAAVYDLVLLDDTNPRSLLFQFNQLVKHFERLPRERESALPSPGHRVLLDCLARLRLLDPRSLASRKANWHHTEAGAVIGPHPAPTAQTLRRHRRQLFRPFRHLPRRQPIGRDELPHPPSHRL